MWAFLATAEIPIVWCYDASALIEQGLSDKLDLIEQVESHRMVRVAKNLSIEQIYALYRDCRGYVSFSKSESYGWSLADAISFGKPICSRRTGVLSYFDDFVATTDFSNPVFSRLTVDTHTFFGKNIVNRILAS